MKEDNAKKWIHSLLIGDYEQGRFKLNKNNTHFCCLGVLCETGINNGVSCDKKMINDDNGVSYSYDGEIVSLPQSIHHWLFGDMGKYNTSQLNRISEFIKNLMKMNDHDKETFMGIAIYISKEIEFWKTQPQYN